MDRRRYLATVGTLATVAAAGCIGGRDGVGSTDAPVTVTLDEWRVVPEAETLPPGELTFHAENEGEDHHELVVRQRAETGALEAVAAVGDISPGTYKPLTVTLAPGRYELACLMRETEPDGETEDHYRLGMHTTVTVGDG